MTIKAQKILDGRHIFLEFPKKSHRNQWVDLRQKNHHFLQPWEPKWDALLLTHPGYRRILSKFKKARKDWKTLVYFIIRKSDQTLIGGISLGEINFGSAKSAAIGYWMGEEYTRNGYMSEAIALICRYGFSQLTLARIEAYCMAENYPSLKLLKKCNFTLEGEARSYLEINGFRENHLIYSLLKTDLIKLAKEREQASFKSHLQS